MRFSELKKRNLRPEKSKALFTFLIALATAMCLFVPYMIQDGGYFIFYGDFNVQQIPFYQHCHEAVKSGNIFWDFGTDLGTNFIGSYTFYMLGSPFFWITLPFPNSFVPYLMAPLLILKFACAALTAYFYIRRFTKTASAASLGGLLYAFSGFSIYNIFFNHFHEALILFPLLLLSMELLLTENRRFVFALTVCACAISNYFFFFGMVVFVLIYFLVRVFSGAIKLKFSIFFVLAFEAVLGLALSAALLLPSIALVSGNSRISEIMMGWNAIMYGKEQIYANALQCFFFPPDMPARPVFFPGAEVRWSSLGGWLPVFSMVGVFTWFKVRKGSWLKRLLGICIFMAMVPILNSAFSAFNTSYYARWYYMPILLMCLATAMLIEDESVDWRYGYGWVLGITLAVTAVIGFFPQKDKDENIIYGLYTQSSDDVYKERFFIACAIAIISLLILAFLLQLRKNQPKWFYNTSIFCVCAVVIAYGNVYVYSGKEIALYDAQDVMIEDLIEGEVDFYDDSEFRVDAYSCVDNTAMFYGHSSINAFHSTVSPSIMQFYDYIGIKRSVASRPDASYAAIRPLLSVKYLLNRMGGDAFYNDALDESAMKGYTYIGRQSGHYLFENENYVPYGFSYDYYMTEEFCETYEGKNRADMMLKAILLTDEQIEKYGHLLGNIENLWEEQIEGDDGRTLYFDYEDMVYDCDRLKQTSAIKFTTDKTGFSATVERDKENLVFFSIPYDGGWTATVNGKPCEIEKVNVGFMAVKVPAGVSEIRFEYRTQGLKQGLMITGIAAFVFAAYIIIYLIYDKKRKKPVEYIYPEGDSLLEEWNVSDNEIAFEEVEEAEEKQSLIDSMTIEIPKIENGFEGGFKIVSDEEEKDK